MKIAAILLSLLLAALLVAGCGGEETADEPEKESEVARSDSVATYATPGRAKSGVIDQRMALPRIVDLGKGECIPCKMMAPILEELTEEYSGRAIIEVIDIGDKPEAVKQYGMRVMPTQVFFDAQGNEVWRHEGFLPKETIIEKLKEMGVEPPDG
jgi:thioredoxin 1